MLISLAVVAIMAVALRLEGRIPWCTCGYIKFWHGVVASSQNSQHLFDWYSFTHVIRGLGFYLLLWLVDRKKRLSFGAKLVIAIGLAASWEIIENSNFVINRYRAATISLDYYGDSIINSIGDIIAMAAGFWFASRARIWQSIALFVAIELVLAYVIRDNLTLNILMLLHPIESIRRWQAG